MIFFPVFHTIQVFGYSWSTQKPRFHMDKRHLVKWRIANFGLFLELFDYFRFRWFFPLFKKFGFWGILGPPYCGIGAAMRIDREMLCLPYAGFLSNVFTILICSRIYWKLFHARPTQRTGPGQASSNLEFKFGTTVLSRKMQKIARYIATQ